MNDGLWNTSSNDGIFSCILDDTILGSQRKNNDNDVLPQETVDQLISVGLKYKKRCKQLSKELANLTKQHDELKQTNAILDSKNNNIIKLLQDQEVTLNQQYINDINNIKEEKTIEIEKLKSSFLAEQNVLLSYKQKYESFDSIRKKNENDKDDIIQRNAELVKQLEESRRDFEVEKMNILLSRDQVSDSERTSLLRRALIAEEKVEKLEKIKEAGNNEEILLELNASKKHIQELEMIVKLARLELLNMNDKMIDLISIKEQIEISTMLVLEENKILRENSK
jgi:hypothetical protein